MKGQGRVRVRGGEGADFFVVGEALHGLCISSPSSQKKEEQKHSRAINLERLPFEWFESKHLVHNCNPANNA